MRRALVVVATLLALAPSALAQAAETEVRLAGPTRATVSEGGATLALTVALSLSGVACPDGGEAVVHVRVQRSDGYVARLSDDAIPFTLPRGDWTARSYSASAPVNLAVEGDAASGSARVLAWIGEEDVSGCVATLGFADASALHEVALSAASEPPTPPVDHAQAPPAPPLDGSAAAEPSRTRPITLREDPLPGPVLMLLAIAAAGAVAIAVQRWRGPRSA